MRFLTIFFLLIISTTVFSLDNSENRFYFPNLFESFDNESEIEQIRKSGNFSKEDEFKEVIFYWIKTVSISKNLKKNRKTLESIALKFEKFWRSDRGNDRYSLLLAYAYTSLAGSFSLAEVSKILFYINKAQNLYNIVVARNPENLDPRLGRTRINMNLTPQNGRPDSVIISDADVYFTAYDKLPAELQKNAYYYMGLMEMRLALAMVYHDQRKRSKAGEIFSLIDSSILPDHLSGFYKYLNKRYGN